MKLKKKQQITAFEVCLYLFFGVLALLTLYPFYNVLIVSFSNTVTSVKYSPYLFPHVFDLTGYKAIIKDVYFFKSLGTTLLVTVLGTTLNMVFSVVAAYVLSRKRLIGRKVFLSAILFTMLFSAGFYGKFVCLHFAPFLSEAITTNEQREAFETIIRYLDGISIAVPSDVQQYLDEIRENADAAVTQSASAALAAATTDPEKYIHDNKEMLEQYRAVTESEEYKASPAYRLQEYLKQFQRESGYNDVFIPAMQRLSPAYCEYHKSLQAANEVFLRHFL